MWGVLWWDGLVVDSTSVHMCQQRVGMVLAHAEMGCG